LVHQSNDVSDWSIVLFQFFIQFIINCKTGCSAPTWPTHYKSSLETF